MRGSASKSSLILSGCSHWMHDAAPGEGYVSKAATNGTTIHGVLQNVLLNQPIPTELAEMAVEYGVPVRDFVSELVRGNTYTAYVEQGLYASLDGDYGITARDGDYAEARERHPAGFFAGTADLFLVIDRDDSTEAIVIDWKSGSPMYARKQLMSLAALAQRTIAKVDAWRCISAKVAPGLVEVGLDFTVPVADLDAHLESILDVFRRGPSAPVLGAHCYEHFCPHREGCKGIRQYYYSYETKTPEALNATSDQDLYRMIVAAKVTEEVSKKRRLHLLDEVTERGGKLTVEDTDGKLRSYEEGTRQVARVDWKEVVAKAKAKGLTDADIDACKRTVTEAAGWKLREPKNG